MDIMHLQIEIHKATYKLVTSHIKKKKIESVSYHSSISHHGDEINKIQNVRELYMTKSVSLTTIKKYTKIKNPEY